MEKIGKVKTAKIYKKILIGFSFVVVLTLAVIIYFSFTKTVITIKLQPIAEKTVFNVDIKNDLSEEDQQTDYILPGVFLNDIIGKSKNFDNTNTGKKADAQATGTVTIYNNYSQPQPLAATTRLLSPDGVLFRTRERVDVPAGGQIDNVEVYADQAGAGGNIGATTFTIPGLWPGLQDKIFAESSTPMTGGVVDAKILTQDLVDAAASELKKEILADAKQAFINNEEIKNRDFEKTGLALATLTLESEVTPEIGEIASQFEVYVKYNIFGILFDEAELVQTATKNLLDKMAMDRYIDPAYSQDINYTPESQNFDDKTATLQVDFTAQTKLYDTSPIFDKEKLTGKTASEINRYFSNYEGILSVITNFSPFWVTETPSLTDHIKLEIE